MMTKVIKILGTGCPKCQSMTAVVKDVVSANNIDATIEKVEDIMEIMEFNVISTPALVIDNVVTIKGRVPAKDEVLALIKTKESIVDKNSDDSCCSNTSSCCS